MSKKAPSDCAFENGAVVPIDEMSMEEIEVRLGEARQDWRAALRERFGFTESEAAELEAMVDADHEIELLEARKETVRGMIALVKSAERQDVAMEQLAFGSGIYTRTGQDGPESELAVAARFGMSRQNFNQGKDRLMKRLCNLLPPARHEKQHTENYSLRNYRHPKKV